ncbi:TIGR00251 family protein [Methanocella conradii HZ254]|uniref:UPF0235 protein Mtc_0512 n=2 Tax=Methanocella TaxID=570266 RepID=H8I581_METCZ|nr:TIGR00251 family protein [Methanocella conradii HZ254]
MFLLVKNDFYLMSFEDAIRAIQGGVVIDFEVSPGAGVTRVPCGYNEWRKRIEARLRAPPERGRANEELMVALSRLFRVPRASVEIASGVANGKKSVKIRGITREDAINALRGML